MSDDQFYSEALRRFERMLEKDKRRKRRAQFIFFGIHLVVSSIAALFGFGYLNNYFAHGPNIHDLDWLFVGLFIAGVISLIAHGYAIFAANNTTVQDTVFESLMLLMSQRDLTATEHVPNKAKRRDEYDELALSDDGELTNVPQWKRRN